MIVCNLLVTIAKHTTWLRRNSKILKQFCVKLMCGFCLKAKCNLRCTIMHNKRDSRSIISPSQAYSIPGRDITDTVCTIRNVVDSMEKDGEGGLILCMDLNKAFDRVE